MGLLQGARQNPGAPEDEEWGLQSPLAGLWFGRFCPRGAALRERRLRGGFGSGLLLLM